jgi:hypothetical protein
MANELTLEHTKFNPKQLTFTELEENSRSKGQLIAYPRYIPEGANEEKALFIQSPWITLYTYGVPRLGEYYKTDQDRLHLKVPLNLDNPDVFQFASKLKETDSINSSEEVMKKSLGKKYKKYSWVNIFREGQVNNNDDDDDDDEDDKEEKKAPSQPQQLRPPYLKVKLDLTYPENKIKTQVFISVIDSKTKKRVRTLVENINNIDDFAKHVKYLSNVRLIIKPVKKWAHAPTKKDPQCGIIFKLIKIEVEPPKNSSSIYKQIYEKDNFIDSDDEDQVILKKVPYKLKNKEATDIKINDYDNDSSEELTLVNERVLISQSNSEDESLQLKHIVDVSTDDDDSDNEIVPQTPRIKSLNI